MPVTTFCRLKGKMISVKTLLDRIRFLENKLFEAEKKLLLSEKNHESTNDSKRDKQPDHLLSANEERYRQFFMSSPAIKMIIDPLSGIILNANQAAAKFYGYALEELVGMEIFTIDITPTDKVRNIMMKIYGNPAGKRLSLRHKLKNSTIRDVEVYAGPVIIGDRVLLSVIIVDVTDRKRMEAELRTSRERLSLVVEGAKAGIWDWDMINNRVYYDKQWKAILGYEEHQVAEDFEEWQSRWHPDDAFKIKQAMHEYLQEKTDKYEIEYRLRHKDGTYRWIYTIGKITYDCHRRPVRWAGFNLDITGRKQVEEKIWENERKLRDFAQAVPDVSCIIDEDGRFIEIFSSYDHQLIRPSEELVGFTFHQVFMPEEAAVRLHHVHKTICSEMPQYFIEELELEGVKRWVEKRYAPMAYLANGKKTVAVVITDITERRKTERMLQSAYELRRKSDFINDIISNRTAVDANMIALGKTLGIDFSSPLFCILITSDKFNENDKEDYTAYKLKMHTDIINALDDEKDCIFWLCRNDIGVLYQPGNPHKTGREDLIHIACRLRNKIRHTVSELAMSIGVGMMQTGPDSLYKSFRQAWSAAMAAQSQGGNSEEVYCYWKLGMFQLLAGYGGKECARDFVEENIGKLVIYDRKKGTDFLETLEEILQCANLKEVAGKMFLHHKTIVNRKQRIEKILEISLDHFETRLTIATAIKLYKLNTKLLQN